MQKLLPISFIGILFAAVFFTTGCEQSPTDYVGDDWMTDFAAAKIIAAAEQKPLLLDFTGSDWCGWCIKLDKEVFSQKVFKEFATDNLVLVELDFPRGKEQSEDLKAQNKALSEKYGIRGFPTILVLSPEGELIEKTGYQRGGPEAYVAHIKEILLADK
jgi:thioredoxin-related protein